MGVRSFYNNKQYVYIYSTMKFAAPFLAAGALAQNYNPASYQPAAPAPAMAMDPMMMMLMMGDDNKDMKKLLPLMMMGGGMGGGAAGGMDPMMMMLMMGDDSSDSMSSLLPLMMMGGMGGQGGAAGGMNPLMLMTLLEDDCKLSDAVTGLTGLTDAQRKDIALGKQFATGSGASGAITTTRNVDYVDHDYIKCEKSGSSGMSSLLPLMMMGGGWAAVQPAAWTQ